MAAKRKPLPFEPLGPSGKPASGKQKGDKSALGGTVIPKAVANRMAVRIAIATGVPSVLGMAVFVASYLLVSRGILDIPPVLTLATSGGCFLLGVVGLSYGVLSASWEDSPGSTLGFEQIGVNIPRLRASIRAMGRAGNTPPAG
ncbi:MAG: PAM68 family protein [Cyanobacteria bacterium]|nr:PAM68 family protein [Cyanobacteria bacterium bin.51]